MNQGKRVLVYIVMVVLMAVLIAGMVAALFALGECVAAPETPRCQPG